MLNLNAEIRELSLKPHMLRASGIIPAEIYGKEFNNLHISVPVKEFRKIFQEAGENTIVNLQIGKDVYPVIIHDQQKDSISGDFLSVSFFKVRMDEKITAPIPLVFIGESPAVKELGGILVKSMDEVEVEALPANLPHEIKIDIGTIKELGDNIYVKDISVVQNYTITTPSNTVIATVIVPKEEAEEAPTSIENIVTEGEMKRADSAKTENTPT